MNYPLAAAPPTQDGQVQRYENPEAASTPYWSPNRSVIFINGMANQGADHYKSALGLSLLQMSPVLGVFNDSGGTAWDLVECLGDKAQFQGETIKAVAYNIGVGAVKVTEYAASTLVSGLARLGEWVTGKSLPQAVRDSGSAAHDWFQSIRWESLDAAERFKLVCAADTSRTPRQHMEAKLARNPAALSLFGVLLDADWKQSEIFAHSQGNLITSNALQAAQIVSPGSIAGRVVRSFGSPTTSWPSGIVHFECAFSFDPITYLNSWRGAGGTGQSMSTVASAPVSGASAMSHAFDLYVANDPLFVINTYRWSLGSRTAHMNTAGLAAELVAMRTNAPRLLGVFRELRDRYSSYLGDVATRYTTGVFSRPLVESTAIKSAVRGKLELQLILQKALSAADRTKW